MYALMMMVQQDPEGLTFREIVSEIPTDAASVFVYLLLAACVGVIWFAHRGSGGGHPPRGGAT